MQCVFSGGAAIVFGAGGDYCEYPPEPSGQHDTVGGLTGYGDDLS